MTPRSRMTEREKVYAICLLFPLLWPFIPVLIVCDIGEAIRDRWHAWRNRRRDMTDSGELCVRCFRIPNDKLDCAKSHCPYDFDKKSPPDHSPGRTGEATMTDEPSAERARDDVSHEVIARVQAAADPILSRDDWQQIDPPAEQQGLPVEASAEVSREQAERIAEAVKPEFATGDWRTVEAEQLDAGREDEPEAGTDDWLYARWQKDLAALRSQLSAAKCEIVELREAVNRARKEEREACAQVAESCWCEDCGRWAGEFAAAIRSRT